MQLVSTQDFMAFALTPTPYALPLRTCTRDILEARCIRRDDRGLTGLACLLHDEQEKHHSNNLIKACLPLLMSVQVLHQCALSLEHAL